MRFVPLLGLYVFSIAVVASMTQHTLILVASALRVYAISGHRVLISMLVILFSLVLPITANLVHLSYTNHLNYAYSGDSMAHQLWCK